MAGEGVAEVIASVVRDVLFAAILAEPAENLHRLAFADYLDEMGDGDDRAHAEFIRGHIALCGMFNSEEVDLLFGSVTFYPSFLARANTTSAYQQMLRPLVLNPYVNQMVKMWRSYGGRWRRGFVAEMHLPLADWLAYGASMVRQQPIECVRLTDKQPEEIAGGWWRWPLFDDARADEIPDDLLSLVHEGKPGGLLWPSKELALDAMSHGCLKLAHRSTGKSNQRMRG